MWRNKNRIAPAGVVFICGGDAGGKNKACYRYVIQAGVGYFMDYWQKGRQLKEVKSVHWASATSGQLGLVLAGGANIKTTVIQY